jgi:probable HAF family extracellular repeat protein
MAGYSADWLGLLVALRHGPLEGTFSYGYAVNLSGQVAGYSELKSPASYRAFLYSGGKLTNLGTLGGNFSLAAAINASGQVVGQASTPDNAAMSAFLWQNGKMIDIDTLGSQESIPQAINLSGAVVGRANIAPDMGDEDWHASVYADGQIQDLDDLIPANSGWVLINATGINDSGTIVGYGTLNGNNRAFLLTPGRGMPKCVQS